MYLIVILKLTIQAR